MNAVIGRSAFHLLSKRNKGSQKSCVTFGTNASTAKAAT